MRMHEAAAITERSRIMNSISTAVITTLSMVTQTHVWHWQTGAFSEHETLGNYYEFLRKAVDEFAEVFMGGGGNIRSMRHSSLENYSPEAVRNSINDFKTELNFLQRQIMDSDEPDFDSVADTILDIVKESDRVLYRLGLS